ncbi:MAG: prephenate dehydrogenase/arogenate dehydrogenase family protein [Desulfobacterales bacterium]|nr:prephenate dehydrogenase/arogenate dehydrogenase family protein [Desulfobacterales bacterium]
MTTIATLGPANSNSWQAARQYAPDAGVVALPNLPAVLDAFNNNQVDLAVLPVYNTREGEIKKYLQGMESLRRGHWIDNVMLAINLSLAGLDGQTGLTTIIGRRSDLRQAEDFIVQRFPEATLVLVDDLGPAIRSIKEDGQRDHGIIGPEEILLAADLVLLEREVAPYNQTRFAVIGREPAPVSGYDATAMLTEPLKDRVGLLFDMLGEFTKRGINLIDLRSENDIKSQKLQIYLETEGHIKDKALKQAVREIEEAIIQEPGSVKVLGSFPRVDMRKKQIRAFGFIGTGAMSRWFADKLGHEGYRTLLAGRHTEPTPVEMIPEVDVVVICVPISATPGTVRQYGPLLSAGQALIILAGEAENSLNAALAHTSPEVEVMLVHNLWGPQVTSIKDRNAAVVRTSRSGVLCSEFEAFLYKHGAVINQDTPNQHDLLMGVGQKLPTTISVALAMTLALNRIATSDIGTHSTLTSLYGILAMARVHTQNPRTYAEIMAAGGDGQKIVRSFAENLLLIVDLADQGKIDELCELIDRNNQYLTQDFLAQQMRQALAVDEVLTKR